VTASFLNKYQLLKTKKERQHKMRYIITNKPAMRLIGTNIKTTVENGAFRDDISNFVETLRSSGKIVEMAMKINQKPFGLVSASWIINTSGDGSFDFFIGASSDQQAPQAMRVLRIPESRWAVFSVEGPVPESLIEMGDRLMSKWLPKGEYILNENVPLLNVYLTPDLRSPNCRSEIWIAILGKREES
jgi:AraC family transcriptional regulator